MDSLQYLTVLNYEVLIQLWHFIALILTRLGLFTYFCFILMYRLINMESSCYSTVLIMKSNSVLDFLAPILEQFLFYVSCASSLSVNKDYIYTTNIFT
jgi:hypothetical protein